MEMKTVHIGDLGGIKTGSTPSKKNLDNYGDYALWIKPTDINPDEKYTRVVEEMFSEKAANDCRSRLIPAKSICVPCIGTVGTKLTMTPCDCFVNQSINAVIPNDDYDNDYVYYLLLNFLPNLKSINKGTASGREYIAKSAFENIEIKVHSDITVQRIIGKILSAYDDMIDNCKKQIAILEEAAQRLYREWFVDMRFPGHESTPIGENGLPEGWEHEKVGSLLRKIKRSVLVQTADYKEAGSLPIIDQSRKFIAGYTDNLDTKVSENLPVILFGDHTRILKFITFDFARGADGTQLIISNNLERMPQCLFFLSLKNVDLSNYSYARHFKYLKEEKVLMPTVVLAQKFEAVISLYFNEISVLQKIQNKCLNVRDILLPRLISGQIELNA